jgi:NMD protein affecting ribosome stability and mRNA decay
MNAHVQTVKCPECGRNWTGEFVEPPSEAVCKDCLVHRPDWKKGHPDIHINPTGK